VKELVGNEKACVLSYNTTLPDSCCFAFKDSSVTTRLKIGNSNKQAYRDKQLSSRR